MSTETIKTRAKEIGNMPAFPCTSDQFALGDKGLTKREWLAGMALQGAPIVVFPDHPSAIANRVAECLRYADATLTALAESEAGNG